jgi:hypothetical protein
MNVLEDGEYILERVAFGLQEFATPCLINRVGNGFLVFALVKYSLFVAFQTVSYLPNLRRRASKRVLIFSSQPSKSAW